MLMRAVTVVQQLCKSCRTCFKLHCMFYFTCDRSFTEYAQESDFDFGELPGVVNDSVTTSMTSANVTQQALKPQLVQEELLGDDAGSGIELEEGSGEDLWTTSEDDVTATTIKTDIDTTITEQLITSSTTKTTVTEATTEEPVSGEPG